MDNGNYSEIAPSMGWDTEVGYFAYTGVGAHRPVSRAIIHLHQHPKPEPSIKGRPTLALVKARRTLTPTERAVAEYRRAWRRISAIGGAA